MDYFMAIQNLLGIWLSLLGKKMSKFVQLDDAKVNLKLSGSRSSQTITSFSYKPS